MPEGPSIVLAREAIEVFVGKKVIEASGSSSNVEYGSLHGAKVKSVKSWGKHLLISFSGFTLRIHFLMFGSYAINNPKKNRTPKLSLSFAGGKSLNFYACSIVILDGAPTKHYDWTADVMNRHWDSAKAMKKLRSHPDQMVCDALLDQNIFAGVGNIIKNEVLHRMKIHPKSKVIKIPPSRRKEMIRQLVVYSKEFLKWKRNLELKKHWQVYTKKLCPRDQHVINKEYLGKTKRRTFFCVACQKLYN